MPDVEPDVVAGRFNPVDLVHPQEEQPAAGLDDEAVGARLIPPEVLDERQQPPSEVAGFLAFDLPPRALQGVGEALAIERLEDVVERAHLEGLERVLIVGGHEDHERHALAADRLDDLEAVHVRHLDVEKHQLRRMILDGRHGLLAVASTGPPPRCPPRSTARRPAAPARAARRRR